MLLLWSWSHQKEVRKQLKLLEQGMQDKLWHNLSHKQACLELEASIFSCEANHACRQLAYVPIR